jgi:hypothetical protein
MNIMSKIKLRSLRELNPLWWGLIGWALTIGGYGLGEIMIRSFGVGRAHSRQYFVFLSGGGCRRPASGAVITVIVL